MITSRYDDQEDQGQRLLGDWDEWAAWVDRAAQQARAEQAIRTEPARLTEFSPPAQERIVRVSRGNLVQQTHQRLMRRSRRALAQEIRFLSGGQVVSAPASGPQFEGRRPARRHTEAGTFSWALPTSDRVLIALLSVVWVVAFFRFWIWWPQPEHRVGWAGMVINSLLLLYVTANPLYSLVLVNRLYDVNPDVAVPDLRVAFVVTRAPSEDWPLARATLTAMCHQDYPRPFTVWLCDEDPTEEILRWCATYGVQVSTRKGVGDYHRASWPRRTRCKEGNLAYFYDNWGYQEYDVVAQLDCDHRPDPTYLAEMVRPFADPAVGYVAAPSVCDANADASWSARGRLHREATFHGAFQAGHNRGLAPVCIGSHYAVRTAALREIGGVGPELAEDFSTSFLLTSAGWEGVFALRATAHGDGPLTFAAMLTQEFQWSRSLSTLLFSLAPRHLGRFAWPLRIRFGYALMHYWMLAVTIVVGLLLPPIAAVTGIAWVNVNPVNFVLHWWPMSLSLIAIILVIRRRGLLRPAGAPVISWENWLYAVTRWPYITWGVAAAAMQQLRPTTITFKVTPKGAGGLEPLPPQLVRPFLALTVVLSGAALIGEFHTQNVGYIGLCLLGALTYGVVTPVICLLHAGEAARAARVSLSTAVAGTVRQPLMIGLAVLIPLLAGLTVYPGYAIRVLGW